MKLKVSPIDSISRCLMVTAVAALVLSNPLQAIAQTPQELIQSVAVTPVQRDRLLEASSKADNSEGREPISEVPGGKR